MTNLVNAGRPPLEQLYAAAVIALHQRASYIVMSIDTPAMNAVRQDIGVMAQILDSEERIAEGKKTITHLSAEKETYDDVAAPSAVGYEARMDANEKGIARIEALRDRLAAANPALLHAWNDYRKCTQLAELRHEVERIDDALRRAEDDAQHLRKLAEAGVERVENTRAEKRRKTEAYAALQRAVGAEDE